MHKVKCPYCNEYFDTDLLGAVKVSNRYYHKECYDKKVKEGGFASQESHIVIEPDPEKIAKAQAKPQDGGVRPNYKICLKCHEQIDINKEEYRLIGKRYLHLKCFNELQSTDDRYIDMMYQFLKNEAGIDYNYIQCEKQRNSYNKKGLSNETIYKTLVYIYKIKKINPSRAEGRIGLVPFMYEEALQYFNNLEKQKKIVDKAYEKQKKVETKKMNIVDVKEAKRKGYIDIETIGIDEV